MKKLFAVLILIVCNNILYAQCSPPALVIPANGSNVNTLTPVLGWYPGQYMIYYNLYISLNPNLNPILHSAVVPSNETYYLVPSGILQYNQTYYWKVYSNCFHTSSGSSVYNFNTVLTGILKIVSEIPENFFLDKNYPNPFNPATTINVSIPKESEVTLKIYDITGKEVSSLADGILKAGLYKFTFNATELPSGVYFYKLKTDGYTDTKKMVLIK